MGIGTLALGSLNLYFEREKEPTSVGLRAFNCNMQISTCANLLVMCLVFQVFLTLAGHVPLCSKLFMRDTSYTMKATTTYFTSG